MAHLLILNTTLLMPFSRFYSLFRVEREICCHKHEHERQKARREPRKQLRHSQWYSDFNPRLYLFKIQLNSDEKYSALMT
jgi:hypothetical protein